MHIESMMVSIFFHELLYLIQAKSRYESDIHNLRMEIEYLRQTEKEKLQKLKEKMEREKEHAEQKNQVKIKSLEKEKVKTNFLYIL